MLSAALENSRTDVQSLKPRVLLNSVGLTVLLLIRNGIKTTALVLWSLN